MQDLRWDQLLHVLLAVAFELLTFASICMLAFADRKDLHRYFKAGLVFGLALLVLNTPVSLLGLAIWAPDPHAREKYGTTGESLEKLRWGFTIASSVIAVAVQLAWNTLVYCIAGTEWSRLGRELLQELRARGPKTWRPILVAVAFGLAAGALTTIVFSALGIQANEFRAKLVERAPHLAEVSFRTRFVVSFLFVTGAAIAEELVFRGALLGFLLRVTKESTAGIVGSTILVSLLWASLHLLNTNSATVKVLQIFLTGIFLCEFARRWGITSSIAAHFALNLAALTGETLFL
jgi:membrane protease YdiL (CAAX protease family)